MQLQKMVNGIGFKISDFGRRGTVLYSKNKGADQLRSYFVFAYAKSRLFHDAAHIRQVSIKLYTTILTMFRKLIK